MSEFRKNSALFKLEELIETLFVSTPNVIYAYDLKAKEILYLNSSAGDLLGYNLDEYKEIGLDVLKKIFYRQDLRTFLQHLDQLLKSEKGTSLETEFRVFRSNGRVIWLRCKNNILKYDENGSARVIVGIANDITLQKDKEEELNKYQNALEKIIEERTEELLRSKHFIETIVSKAPIIIFAMEKDGILTFSEGEQLLKKIGLKPGEAVGHNAFELYKDYPEIIDNLKRSLDGEKVTYTTEMMGLYLENIHQPVFDEDGNMSYVIGVAFDITEQKKIQDKLNLSHERFNLATEASSNGIWDWNIISNEVYFSDQWKRILGYQPEELNNDFDIWVKLLHPEDRAKAVYYVDEYVKNPIGEFIVQFRMKHKNGTYRWINAKASPMFDEEGNIIRLIGAHTDITDIKEKELELIKYSSALENSNKDLEDFAYIASHDLQEPLRKIQSFGDLLNATISQNLNRESHDYLIRMINAAKRMQNLVNDLLSYSRVSTKGRSFEKTDLNEVLSEVLDDLALIINESDAKIYYDDLPNELLVDKSQIHSVFINLISNSLKFRKDEESPIISIRYSIEKKKNKNYHKLVIEDNGIGFNQNHSKKIFTIFQRLHGPDRYHGTGLGLAIAKKIIERHDGIIEAVGIPDEGAKFLIYLPSKQKEEAINE